ncbi:sperm-tail PG-rich repeat-containing protein 2 [Anguilla rostrata]|uniref:sperm-tail PG-rich repeat-containing protein 2 n=1 Tax=Anguilla rostrata TaxID=7938 RepID=UPI0030CE039C
MASPGPGQYDTSPVKGVSNLLKSLRQPDIPSIPSPGQAFGYEESDQGILHRQPLPPKDDTLGPAYYCPLVAESSSSQKYRGVHFGKMTGRRGEARVSEGPGPGEYSPEENHGVLYENVNVKKESRSRAELVLPRYPEMLTLREEKKGVPGPGQYNIKSQFERTGSRKKDPAVNPPFLFQAQRFIPVKEAAPPVGLYEDPRSALDALKKTTGLKRSPFGQTAVRFVPPTGKSPTPGPGAYNVFDYGMAQDSLRRALLERNKKGGFGSRAQRNPAFVKREEAELPGPAQYRVEKTLEEPYKQKHTAVFKSVTERLTSAQAAQATPPPSCYNVHESFERTHGRTFYMPPRNEGARKRQSCFLSAAPRLSSFQPPDPDIPGPGQYSPAVKSSPKMALIVSQEDRFKEPKDIAPSPATYELSPAIMDTVLKGTFNVTLDNPLAARPHAPPLQSTAQPALALTSA